MADDIVLVDTDVWSLVVSTTRDREPRVGEWRRLLLGRELAIAAQTEAELLFGAYSCGWGTPRLAALRTHLARTSTLHVNAKTIEAFARLRADCKQQGHALAEKQHMGDAWVAATAIAHDLPLLSGDGLYANAPTLRLLQDEN